ncbi:hypothetical protein Tco_1099559 [Tanacetum coccineum]
MMMMMGVMEWRWCGSGGRVVVVTARDREWVCGSNRSGGEEAFWSSPENSAGKVFRRRRGGGGRNSRRRWWWGGGRIKGEGESSDVAVMSSSTVTYMSISSDSDLPPWGFHLMDPDEFEAPYLYLLTSPTALSPGYVADSDPLKEDPEEDLEEDLTDYPVDEGDDEEEEEESSEDDDDDDDDEEEEHLAPTNSVALPTIDPVPSAEETEPFETDESTTTPPPPPQTIVLVSMTRLHRARISVRPHTPLSPSTKALTAEYAFAPTPPSPPPSPLLPLSSLLPRIPSPPLLLPPLHTSPTYASAPLGYKATMANMPSRKRLCLTSLAFRFEVGESSTIAVTGQT